MSFKFNGIITNIDLLNFIITVKLENELSNPSEINCEQKICISDKKDNNTKIEGHVMEVDFANSSIKVKSEKFVYFIFSSIKIEISSK